MDLFELIIVGAAALALAYVAVRVGRWLVNWARNAVRYAIAGIRRGVVQLVDNGYSILGYALGAHRGRLEVVEEIEIDESDLDEDVLQALREHGAVRENFHC